MTRIQNHAGIPDQLQQIHQVPRELFPVKVIMGISVSTAQVLAPLSFAVDFGVQLYGMLSSPNMKQIHDRNMSVFSPYANMIGYFFFPQQLLQLWWIRTLWQNPQPDQIRYVPYYALGNFCIAGWMLFWVITHSH